MDAFGGIILDLRYRQWHNSSGMTKDLASRFHLSFPVLSLSVMVHKPGPTKVWPCRKYCMDDNTGPQDGARMPIEGLDERLSLLL